VGLKKIFLGLPSNFNPACTEKLLERSNYVWVNFLWEEKEKKRKK